jgi:hypothetical protein
LSQPQHVQTKPNFLTLFEPAARFEF